MEVGRRAAPRLVVLVVRLMLREVERLVLLLLVVPEVGRMLGFDVDRGRRCRQCRRSRVWQGRAVEADVALHYGLRPSRRVAPSALLL